MTNYANACPICARHQPPRAGHPRYLCAVCTRHTVDGEGRRIRFYNPITGGGVRGVYVDTGEVTPARLCFVQGIPCLADEVRFGGVIIQALPPCDAKAA